METSEGEIPVEIKDSGDPPTNNEGRYICSRACVDGSQCLMIVPVPYLACYQHSQDESMVAVEN